MHVTMGFGLLRNYIYLLSEHGLNISNMRLGANDRNVIQLVNPFSLQSSVSLLVAPNEAWPGGLLTI